jgi:ubiquinone/menaquinone biosynthesis C-methylase UbiE
MTNNEISNSYEDSLRAQAYAKLEFHDTYYLAYRDIPEIILKHTKGRKALDFGCGTGRSTRYLQASGFDVIGVDISQDMLNIARKVDPKGDYRLLDEVDFSSLKNNKFDLILSAFTFDNIPTKDKKLKIFNELKNLLHQQGIIINLVSSPQIYLYEWASFSTKDYPENKFAQCGDKVKIIIKSIGDDRPVEDIVWPEEDYLKLYDEVGLQVLEVYRPLATGEEPYKWISEMTIAPWVIYILEAIN